MKKSDLRNLKRIHSISSGLLTVAVGILLIAIFFKIIYWQTGITALLIAFGIYSLILFFPKPLLKAISKLRKGE